MTEIDCSRIRSLTARRLISAPERDGFIWARQVGSHRHYKSPSGKRVTVTFHHPSDTFPLKTLRSMIEIQAQWKWEDLTRLDLI
jgi:predicted RNA binding protein YcfA (HicA-like mRNA interferase family)